MWRSASRFAPLLLVALLVAPVAARAQEESFTSATAVGVTVQAIGTSGGWAEVPAVALHITSIRASGLGVDVTLGTLPSALASGVFLLAPDVGMAGIFPIGGGAFMLKGGPSGVVVSTEGAAGGALGFHVGAVAFIRLGDNLGIRAEVVPRIYSFEGGSAHLVTFGIGLTSLPQRFR
jgi:hypothetical protein